MSTEDQAIEILTIERLLDRFANGEQFWHYTHKPNCERFPELCRWLVYLTDRLNKLRRRSAFNTGRNIEDELPCTQHHR